MDKKNLAAFVMILIVFTAIIYLTMGWGMGFPMMGSWMMGRGGWMGWGIAFFWVLIVVGAYILIRGFAVPRIEEHDRALAIAKERYARGEITLEEFEEIKSHLSEREESI